MSNYIEYKKKIAAHPGYLIEEIIEDKGITQEEFAKKLGTTPKNLCLLLKGEQRLTVDIATKLSRMIGTSVEFWLNMQSGYDAFIAKINSDKELENEKLIFKDLSLNYFAGSIKSLSNLKTLEEQIAEVRTYLFISSLSLLKNKTLALSLRNKDISLSEDEIIKSNIMVLIASNKTMNEEAPKFNKKKLEKAAKVILSFTKHKDFYDEISKELLKAGVVLSIVPDLKGSIVSSASKKVAGKVMLMVNDKELTANNFWYVLFHEIGHILNDDYGVSLEHEVGEREDKVNQYAFNALISQDDYDNFKLEEDFSIEKINSFAQKIDRSPSIVLGRLEHDEIIDKSDFRVKELRYRLVI